MKPVQLLPTWCLLPVQRPLAPVMILSPVCSEAVGNSDITCVVSQVGGLQLWEGLLRLEGPTCSF